MKEKKKRFCPQSKKGEKRSGRGGRHRHAIIHSSHVSENKMRTSQQCGDKAKNDFSGISVLALSPVKLMRREGKVCFGGSEEGGRWSITF